MTEWWKTEGDGSRITVQMYHNHPPCGHTSEQGHDPAFSLWMHHGWNPFMVTEAFVASGLVTYDSPALSQAIDKAYKAATASTTGHQPPREDDNNMDVFWLMGSVVELKRFANHWSKLAIDDAAYIGGDDSYYDYYPDFLAGLWQLCRALDYPDPYKDAAANAWATRYDGDDEAQDLIPPYDKED
jgi:hypothetical protein